MDTWNDVAICCAHPNGRTVRHIIPVIIPMLAYAHFVDSMLNPMLA